MFSHSFIVFVVGTLFTAASCSQHAAPDDPNVVVFRDRHGRTLTAGQLKEATGNVQYEILGSVNISPEAHKLHQEAREAGRRGNYGRALSLLEQSHQLAPDWPYPIYDTAFTYLLMKDFAKARENYREVVQLSPRGFFTAITALDCLERKARGELPEETYLTYVSLEWTPDPRQQQRTIKVLVENVPQLAPGWEKMASITEADDAKLDAIE